MTLNDLLLHFGDANAHEKVKISLIYHNELTNTEDYFKIRSYTQALLTYGDYHVTEFVIEKDADGVPYLDILVAKEDDYPHFAD